MADEKTEKLESPDGLELRAKPKISARLNKKAVIIAGAAFAGVFLFIVANVSKGPPDITKNPTESLRENNRAANTTADALTKDIPDKPLLLPAEPPALPKENAQTPKEGGSPTVPPINASNNTVSNDVLPAPAFDAQPAMTEALMKAMNADSSIVKSDDAQVYSKTTTQAAPVATPAPTAAPQANSDDPNRQGAKGAFVEQSRQAKPPTYEIVELNAPVNEFEVKAGSVIPGALITYLNSDLPGEIVGQVSQNVFDSASGRYLLIPQGSRLFGRYDSNITFGQERVLVVWHRLIFPNGNSMDLGGMTGHDTEGTSGYHDLVNNHYVRTFGAALITSMFAAAFQLSQKQTPDSVASTAYLTNQQIAAASVGQQMTQLGIQFASKNLQVQPTLEIRKGYAFNVMVNKDLVFPGPYKR